MKFPIAVVWVLASCSLLAEPATLRLVHSDDARFALEVGKTGLMSGKKHVFEFSRYSGEVLYNASEPEQSRVYFTAESASIECKDDWGGDKQQKKVEDYALDTMLAAGKFPELRFDSTRITQKTETEFEVTGTLTIRDVSQPVVVKVSLETESGNRILFTGQSIIKMKDYGLKPPKAALGLIGTKNEMLVLFRLAGSPAATE